MPPTPTEGEDRAAPSPGKLMLPLDFFELPASGVRQHRLEDAVDRLALDMKERGQTSPILFYRKGLKGVVIGGGTRWLAARQLRWEAIWAEERPVPAGEFDAILVDFLDNEMQTPLDPLDEAAAFARGKELNPGLKDKVLAARFKVSPTKWSRRLAMFRGASPQTMQALSKGLITADSAALMARLSHDLQQVIVAEAEGQGHLKHRTVMRMVKELKPGPGRKPTRCVVDYKGVRLILDKPEYDDVIQKLRRLTRAAVMAKRKNRPLKHLSDLLRDDDGPKAA